MQAAGTASVSSSATGRGVGLRRATEQLLLGVLPILSVPIVFVLTHPLHNFAVDFNSWYWPAGRDVLNGTSPYAGAPWRALNYPAPAALLFVVFALLPHTFADAVFTAVVLGCLAGSLWLLDVRDWRVYGVVMFWQPVIVGYETANVSLILLLGVAICWRWRERPGIVGATLGILTCIKIFPVLLGIWLLAGRRLMALAWTAVSIIVLSCVAWSIIGFDQIAVYLHVLRAVRRYDELRGYSLISMVMHLGVQPSVAYAVGFLAAAVVVVLSLRIKGPERDRVVFTACIAACLLAAPLVESHYLVLLLAPLALAQPRLGWAWGLGVVLLVTPADFPTAWQHMLSLCVFAAIVMVCVRARPQERSYGLAQTGTVTNQA